MILAGDARRLPLADGSVQCVVTSPPYWSLRKYAGEQALTWGGIGGCEHDFNRPTPPRRPRSEADATTKKQKSNAGCYYGAEGGNLCEKCGAWRGAYGLEPVADCLAWAQWPCGPSQTRMSILSELCNRCYVCHTVLILRECRRVLRDDGVLFCNLADSYAKQRSARKERFARDAWEEHSGRPPMAGNEIGTGLKPKDLCLIPQRVALAAQRDGWWVRSDIIWSKPNPMPESCKDRPTDAYEHILMLTKSARYFWDAEAVVETQSDESIARRRRNRFIKYEPPGQLLHTGLERPVENGANRNMRNAWTFAPEPMGEWTCSACKTVVSMSAYRKLSTSCLACMTEMPRWDGKQNKYTCCAEPKVQKRCRECGSLEWGSHFATFPEELPRRCIKAATSARGACARCGAAWERVTRLTATKAQSHKGSRFDTGKTGTNGEGRVQKGERFESRTVGWRPGCKCGTQETLPCIVIDPFAGSGTTGRVALELGRRFIGIDLAYGEGKDSYAALARARMSRVQPVLWEAP